MYPVPSADEDQHYEETLPETMNRVRNHVENKLHQPQAMTLSVVVKGKDKRTSPCLYETLVNKRIARNRIGLSRSGDLLSKLRVHAETDSD